MKQLRKILFPFAILYDLVTRVRNQFYDKGLFSSTRFDIPVICVGNLSVGGTGKSPMVEFLVKTLKENASVATLSRGYGRKTKGYRSVQVNDVAQNVGDEPLQLKKKFPKVHVAVCESRALGIEQLKASVAPELVILDDAYQHRSVSPSFTILLTAYDDLYADDLLLPAGNLRESKKGASRANVIIVTKCPPKIALEERNRIGSKLNPLSRQKLFFSTVEYDTHMYGEDGNGVLLSAVQDKDILLVTGIAKPEPFVDHIASLGFHVDHMAFRDHHNFSLTDISTIKKRAGKRLVLTTEKDYVRLAPLLHDEQLYYLPIAFRIIDQEEDFVNLVLEQRKKA